MKTPYNNGVMALSKANTQSLTSRQINHIIDQVSRYYTGNDFMAEVAFISAVFRASTENPLEYRLYKQRVFFPATLTKTEVFQWLHVGIIEPADDSENGDDDRSVLIKD